MVALCLKTEYGTGRPTTKQSSWQDWVISLFTTLRHCAINNLRLAGNDHYLIKEMSGHKTDSAFKRYNLVTEEEMNRVKWLDEGKSLDTYVETSTSNAKG